MRLRTLFRASFRVADDTLGVRWGVPNHRATAIKLRRAACFRRKNTSSQWIGSAIEPAKVKIGCERVYGF
jgi:hypothetical protein